MPQFKYGVQLNELAKGHTLNIGRYSSAPPFAKKSLRFFIGKLPDVPIQHVPPRSLVYRIVAIITAAKPATSTVTSMINPRSAATLPASICRLTT